MNAADDEALLANVTSFRDYADSDATYLSERDVDEDSDTYISKSSVPDGSTCVPTCCRRGCYENIDKDRLSQWRDRFGKLGHEDQEHELWAIMRPITQGINPGSKKLQYHSLGHKLCRPAFWAATEAGSRLRSMRKTLTNGSWKRPPDLRQQHCGHRMRCRLKPANESCMRFSTGYTTRVPEMCRISKKSLTYLNL